MRILALVPVRRDCKRLPRKNIRSLGSKPLIVWSIDAAKKMPEICDIVICYTAIAEICKESGAFVPRLRAAELATDIASSVDVAIRVLGWSEAAVNGLLLLRPTSPFRTVGTLRRAAAKFKKEGRQCAVARLSPANRGMVRFIEGEGRP